MMILQTIVIMCMYIMSVKFYAVTVDIDGVSQINYALIQAPTFTSSYIQTDIKVHFVMLLNNVIMVTKY